MAEMAEYQEKSTVNGSLLCHICKMTFISVDDLHQHILSHSDAISQICSALGMNFQVSDYQRNQHLTEKRMMQEIYINNETSSKLPDTENGLLHENKRKMQAANYLGRQMKASIPGITADITDYRGNSGRSKGSGDKIVTGPGITAEITDYRGNSGQSKGSGDTIVTGPGITAEITDYRGNSGRSKGSSDEIVTGPGITADITDYRGNSGRSKGSGDKIVTGPGITAEITDYRGNSGRSKGSADKIVAGPGNTAADMTDYTESNGLSNGSGEKIVTTSVQVSMATKDSVSLNGSYCNEKNETLWSDLNRCNFTNNCDPLIGKENFGKKLLQNPLPQYKDLRVQKKDLNSEKSPKSTCSNSLDQLCRDSSSVTSNKKDSYPIKRKEDCGSFQMLGDEVTDGPSEEDCGSFQKNDDEPEVADCASEQPDSPGDFGYDTIEGQRSDSSDKIPSLSVTQLGLLVNKVDSASDTVSYAAGMVQTPLNTSVHLEPLDKNSFQGQTETHLSKHRSIHFTDKLYSCSKCGKQFRNQSNLKRHSTLHSNMRYTCFLCNMQYVTMRGLRMHRSVHKENSRHTCGKCGIRFSSLFDLQNHMVVHSSGKKQFKNQEHLEKQFATKPSPKFCCKTCNRQFVYKRSLQKHEVVHKEDNPNTCSICNAKFPTDYHLGQHLLVHLEEKQFSCTLCDSKYLCSSNLNRHIRAKHADVIFCKICGRNFENKNALELHVKSHRDKENQLYHDNLGRKFLNMNSEAEMKKMGNKRHTTSENQPEHENRYFSVVTTVQSTLGYRNKKKKIFQCKACNKIYYRPQHLKDHVLTHTGEKPMKCKECGKRFKTKQDLRSHMVIHAEYRDYYTCEICGKSVTTLESLKNHLDSHTGKKKYMCDICGIQLMYKSSLRTHKKLHDDSVCTCDLCNKNFSTLLYLTNHIRYTHFDGNMTTCSICNKEIKGKSHLNKHMRLHFGEKSHQCEVCGKKFSEFGNLKKHMVSHSDNKPFSCNFCTEKFKKMAYLKTHLLIHTGEKPHSCKLCGKSYRQQGSLNTHKRKAHPNQ